MPEFAQNFIAGVQAGRQHVQAQADHERQLEELDLKKKILKHQMDQFELESRIKQQEHDVQMAEAKKKFFTGADPGNDVSNGVSGVTGGQSLLEAFAKGGPGARVDTSAMQPVGQNPMVEFPGGGSVRPPTQLDLAEAFRKQKEVLTQGQVAQTQAETEKQLAIEREKAKLRAPERPTEATLAVAAAGGDAAAAKALQLMNPPKPASGTGIPRLVDLVPDEQVAIQDLARRVTEGEMSVSDARGLLGGVHGGKGKAFTEALLATGSRVAPPKVREGLQDLKRTQNLVTEIRDLVNEIAATTDPAERIKKSVILENYTKSVGTMLARGFGERGIVTDADRNAAIGLVPGWKSSNFAPQFAQEKLAILDKMIERNSDALTKDYFERIPTRGFTPSPAAATRPRAQSPDGKIVEFDGKSWIPVK